MALLINSSNEDKRYINFQVIPQNISRKIAAAFQKKSKRQGVSAKYLFLILNLKMFLL